MSIVLLQLIPRHAWHDGTVEHRDSSRVADLGREMMDTSLRVTCIAGHALPPISRAVNASFSILPCLMGTAKVQAFIKPSPPTALPVGNSSQSGELGQSIPSPCIEAPFSGRRGVEGCVAAFKAIVQIQQEGPRDTGTMISATKHTRSISEYGERTRR